MGPLRMPGRGNKILMRLFNGLRDSHTGPGGETAIAVHGAAGGVTGLFHSGAGAARAACRRQR